MSICQQGPHTLNNFSAYISQMGCDLEMLLQLEPIGSVLRTQLEAWRTNSASPVPFETPVYQTFFLNLPTCLSPSSLGLEPSRNVFAYLYVLQTNPKARQSYNQNCLPCTLCLQPSHRGHCLVAKTENDFDHLRVTFALGPVFVWMDQLKQQGEIKIHQWIESRFTLNRCEVDIQLQQCLIQAEDTLDEMGFLMSGVVNDIMEVNVFGDEEEDEVQLNEEEINLALDQFVDYVEETCGALLEKLSITNEVDAIEAEHDLICEEVFTMQKSVKQAQDKIQSESELDLELAKATARQAQLAQEMTEWNQRACNTGVLLRQTKIRHQDRLAGLRDHLQIEKEAQTLRLELEQAKAQLALAKRQYKQSRRLTPQQRGQIRFPCVCCTKEGSGVLHPCRHLICIACFRDTQHTSSTVGVPFLHPNCPICAVEVVQIDFATFEFNPRTGVEQYKV
ncbi:hypothetical protein BASA81_008698 [Batrachochytrium salamandrivorans]|nr:hypothetical protein BASA81_008698 [Batrachochytrium salamandrivorans]